MTDPIVLPVPTSTDGLELVETLARRGFAATLVSEPAGWRVEIPASPDHGETLLDAVSLALLDSTAFPRVAAPIWAGERRRDLRLRRAVAAPSARAV